MTTPHTVAVGYLRRCMAHGQTLEAFLAAGIRGQGTPSTDTAPGVMIQVRAHELRVELCWRDGRCESAVYDARRLWATAWQLGLWEV